MQELRWLSHWAKSSTFSSRHLGGSRGPRSISFAVPSRSDKLSAYIFISSRLASFVNETIVYIHLVKGIAADRRLPRKGKLDSGDRIGACKLQVETPWHGPSSRVCWHWCLLTSWFVVWKQTTVMVVPINWPVLLLQSLLIRRHSPSAEPNFRMAGLENLLFLSRSESLGTWPFIGAFLSLSEIRKDYPVSCLVVNLICTLPRSNHFESKFRKALRLSFLSSGVRKLRISCTFVA